MSRAHLHRRKVVSVERTRLVPAVLHMVTLDCGHKVGRVVVGRQVYGPAHLWCDRCADEGNRRRGISAPPVRTSVLTWPPVPIGRGSSGVKWMSGGKAS